MRYFKLENSDGELLDITTTRLLFHDIEGIGFEEENTFVPIGRVWNLQKSDYRQTPVTGKLCFVEDEVTGKTPYTAYKEFWAFIDKTPLILLYYPNGLNTTEYRKRVRVSKLEKSEINEYGVLDCDIEFIPYTPWYKVVKDIIDPEGESSANGGWIWDRGNRWRDSLDVDYSTYHYKFNGSYRRTLRFISDINGNGPVKLSIHGPLVNPTWTQYVDGELVSTGGLIENSPVTIDANEILTIDNTSGVYSMTVYNTETAIERNVYEYRDFNKPCFFTLRQGVNEIVINTDNNDAIKIEAEGHIYYATV